MQRRSVQVLHANDFFAVRRGRQRLGSSHPLHKVERRGRRATLAAMGRGIPRISTAVAMLIRLEWPMHSTEQPTEPEGDHGGGVGLGLDSVT